MATNINFANDSNGANGTSISYNLPRKIYRDSLKRAVAAGATAEAESCTYNIMLDMDYERLLNRASLLVTPTLYKQGVLYPQIPTYNSNGDFSVTRATTATRVNAAGLVELVPYNLVTYSEQFNNANWGKSGTGVGAIPIVTANTTSSPIGTLTADRIQLSLNGGTSLSDISTLTQSVSTTSAIFSIYAKSNTTPCTIYLRTGASAITINLTTEWQRFEYYSSAAITIVMFGLRGGSYGGAVNSDTADISVWGAQVNEGTSALDYQMTETRLNIPRLDYSLGSCPNILLEPQRTNLALRSEEFDNVAWGKFDASITPNTTTSPSGVVNADSFIENTATALHQCAYQSAAVGGTYTATVYAKPNGRNWVLISIAGAANYAAWFDVQNGVVGTIQSNITSASITPAGNGWYRCTMTANTVALPPRISITLSTGNNIFSYLGNGTSGVFLWGAQLEAGAYATSYIPTTSASVTRNADQVLNTSATSLIGQTQGTIFLDFTLLPNNANTSYLFSISDGTQSNLIKSEILVVSPTLSQFRTGIATLGASQMDAFTNITQLNNKMAISYKLNEVKIFLNGVLVVTDTTATIPATSGVYLGSRNNVGNYIGSYYKSFMLFPTPLTDGEMSMLTSGVYTPALAYAQLGLVSESPACLDSSVNALL